jgi:hypothetical protein
MKLDDGIDGDKSAILDFIAKALNEIGPELDARARQGSKRAAALLEFDSTLRRLTDQWIDSGKDWQDGTVDEPHRRNILWHSTRFPEPIFRTLTTFWDRNRPQVIVQINGRSTVKPEPKPSLNTKDLSLGAREHAIYHFQQLLDSPIRERLSRCDACRAYFVRARAPKKDTPIFRGTFCSNPNCKGKGSVKRMNATRETRTKQRVELAAKLWSEWTQRKRQLERSKWVAREMNNTLFLGGEGITGKWVTQHQKEIEAEIERRSHAKS